MAKAASDAIPQAGVLPLRRGPDGMELLLVTSRKAGRWIPPKGHLEPAMTAGESAAREAWEEAGVLGEILESPTACWTYHKRRGPHTVILYPMMVTEALDVWPESHKRRRRWFPLAEAASHIDDPCLRAVLAAFASGEEALGQARRVMGNGGD